MLFVEQAATEATRLKLALDPVRQDKSKPRHSLGCSQFSPYSMIHSAKNPNKVPFTPALSPSNGERE
jgi:hypothetical protein